jgi:sulfatase maturation enzyme AslB (radical SAM superfamily)
MAGLKSAQRPLEGRCAECQHLSICGGNSRTRAWQLTGNPWAEDPGCYLSDEEIGVIDMPQRVELTPYRRLEEAQKELQSS